MCSQHGQEVGYPPTTCTALNTKYMHVYITSFHSPSHTSSQCPLCWPEEPLPHTLHSAGYQPTGVGGRGEEEPAAEGGQGSPALSFPSDQPLHTNQAPLETERTVWTGFW